MENGQLRGELIVKVGGWGLARLSSFENNQNDHNTYQLLDIKKPHCFPQLFENVIFFMNSGRIVLFNKFSFISIH